MIGDEVVVSGWGVVSSCGSGVERFSERLFAGNSGIRLAQLDLFGWSGEVLAGFADLNDRPRFVSNPRADRVTALAVMAVSEAIESAGLDSASIAGLRVGIYVGCAFGGAESLEEAYKAFYEDKRSRLRPTTVPSAMPSAAAAEISIRYGLRGPQFTYSMACASGAVAIGEAGRAVASGQIDIAIAGGTEAMLSPAVIHAWRALGVLAPPDPLPEQSCRPFSADRSGLVMAEGAAFLLLERSTLRASDTRQRIGVLAGYGISSDAASLTAPAQDGQVRAMRAALIESSLEARHVGYINAHATGTRNGDEVESAAIEALFMENLSATQVSSTKSLHGHCMGAAGAIEAVAALIALQERRAVPAYFVRAQDGSCRVKLSDGSSFDRHQRAVLSNSFAFGGVNASLVFSA